MKLNIIINQPGYQLAGEASSLTEFTELRDYLEREGLLDGGARIMPTEKVADIKATAEVKAEKPADPKPAAETAKAKPGPKSGAKAAATAKTAAGPTIEEVTAALTAVADAFGVPEAFTMNQRFGVKKAGELKPEQYADYIKFAKHCVDDEAAPSGAHPEFDGDGGAPADEDVSGLV